MWLGNKMGKAKAGVFFSSGLSRAGGAGRERVAAGESWRIGYVVSCRVNDVRSAGWVGLELGCLHNCADAL